MLIYLTSLVSWIIASAMENFKSPFKGIIKDVRGRMQCYKQDWTGALGSGVRYDLFCIFWNRMRVINCMFGWSTSWYILILNFRILAPTAYIFFASALPVIAFGEQLNRETGTILVYTNLFLFTKCAFFFFSFFLYLHINPT